MKLKLLFSKNNFYVIECSPSGLRAAVLDWDGNKIKFKKYFEREGLDNAENFLAKFNPGPDSKVLLLYDRPLAATYAGLVKLEKLDQRTPISENDFNAFLSSANDQFFKRYWEEAKRKLSMDELGIVLANNRFLGFKLDGKQVVNPIGLKAKLAELEVEQTFLSRQFLELLHNRFSDVKNVFHMELSGALRDVFSRIYSDKKILLTLVGHEKTQVFSFGQKNRYFGAVSFPKVQDRAEFNWGSGSIFKALSEKWGLDRKGAEKVMALYANGGMSKYVERAFEKAIEGPVLTMKKELGKVFKKEDKILVLSEAHFMKYHEGEKLPIAPIEMDEVLHYFNYEITVPGLFPKEGLSPVFIAGLVAYSNRTSDNYLNMLAREQMRWLQPLNSA